MELKKIKDLKKVKLPVNTLLVEFVEKKSSLIMANSDQPSSNLEKEVVALSTCEDIHEGDIILDCRYPLLNGSIAVHAFDDRKFTVVQRHDVKMWTDKENVKED